MYKVAIFGTGSGNEIVRKYLKKDVQIVAYVENDSFKWGKSIGDTAIIPPSELNGYEYDYLIIASDSYENIIEGLLGVGISRDVIVCFFSDTWCAENGDVLSRLFLLDENLEEDAKAFWTASYANKTIQDLSHWRGVGRFSESNWLKVGEVHYNMYKKLIRLAYKEPQNKIKILEWGAGGGANAYIFCKELDAAYYDVDISLPNIKEAERQVTSLGKGEFHNIYLNPPSDFTPVKVYREFFDLALSTAVFQHFPSKSYGEEVVRIIADSLKEDALYIIQIRYDDGKELYKPKSRDYYKNAITFTSYGIDEFKGILEANKLEVLDMAVISNNNYCYFMGRKII